MSGLDEAVIKNVEACKQLSKITRTSLGPNGARAPAPPSVSQTNMPVGAVL
jgi:chaperonin GroEL (HSP60 family)